MKLTIKEIAIIVSGLFIPFVAAEIVARKILIYKNIPIGRDSSLQVAERYTDTSTPEFSPIFHHISAAETRILNDIQSSDEEFNLILGDSWMHLAFNGSTTFRHKDVTTYVLAQPGWSPLIYRSILQSIQLNKARRILIFLDNTDPGDDWCRYKHKTTQAPSGKYYVNGTRSDINSTLFDPIYSAYLGHSQESFALAKISKILLYKKALSLIAIPNESVCGVDEILGWMHSLKPSKLILDYFSNTLSSIQSHVNRNSFEELVIIALAYPQPHNSITPILHLCEYTHCDGSFVIKQIAIDDPLIPVDRWGHLSQKAYAKIRSKVLELL